MILRVDAHLEKKMNQGKIAITPGITSWISTLSNDKFKEVSLSMVYVNIAGNVSLKGFALKQM